MQVDVVDGASRYLQESLQGTAQQLPEAARRLTKFLDDAITQALLDDAPVMDLVGRLVQRALQLPSLVQVHPLTTSMHAQGLCALMHAVSGSCPVWSRCAR